VSSWFFSVVFSMETESVCAPETLLIPSVRPWHQVCLVHHIHRVRVKVRVNRLWIHKQTTTFSGCFLFPLCCSRSLCFPLPCCVSGCDCEWAWLPSPGPCLISTPAARHLIKLTVEEPRLSFHSDCSASNVVVFGHSISWKELFCSVFFVCFF